MPVSTLPTTAIVVTGRINFSKSAGFCKLTDIGTAGAVCLLFMAGVSVSVAMSYE